MKKQELLEEFNKFSKIVDELNYLLLILQKVIEDSDEDEIDILSLDIMAMLINYPYDKQRLNLFRKEMERMIGSNDIKIELNNSDFEKIVERIIKNIKK